MQNKRAIKWSVQPDRSRSRDERERGVVLIAVAVMVCVCVIDIQAQLIGTLLIVCTYFNMGYCCAVRAIHPFYRALDQSKSVGRFLLKQKLNSTLYTLIHFFPFQSLSLLFGSSLLLLVLIRARTLSLVAHSDNDDEWTMYMFSRCRWFFSSISHLNWSASVSMTKWQLPVLLFLWKWGYRSLSHRTEYNQFYCACVWCDDIVIVFCTITHTRIPYSVIHCLSVASNLWELYQVSNFHHHFNRMIYQWYDD